MKDNNLNFFKSVSDSNFDKYNYRKIMVNPKDLKDNPFRRLDKGYTFDLEIMEGLKQFIKQDGMKPSIEITPGKNFDKIITSGHHRKRVAILLHLKEIPVTEVTHKDGSPLNDFEMLRRMGNENINRKNSVQLEYIYAVIDYLLDIGQQYKNFDEFKEMRKDFPFGIITNQTYFTILKNKTKTSKFFYEMILKFVNHDTYIGWYKPKLIKDALNRYEDPKFHNLLDRIPTEKLQDSFANEVKKSKYGFKAENGDYGNLLEKFLKETRIDDISAKKIGRFIEGETFEKNNPDMEQREKERIKKEYQELIVIESRIF